MMKNKLEIFLQTYGFFQLASRLSEVSALVKFENNLVNIVQIIEYSEHLYLSKEQFEDVKKSLKKMFQDKGISEIHVLTVILSSNDSKSEILMEGDSFCWQIDTDHSELVIKEDKHPDFYGMKGLLLDFLHKYKENPEQFKLLEEETVKYPTKKERFISYWKKAPHISISIIVINLILCFCCIVNPQLYYGKGALGLSYVLQGEYYRLLSSIFLHGSMDHFFSNMLLLYFMGNILERRVGRVRFLILYLLTGVLGNIFSCFYEYISGVHYISYGASGAVFGAVGMLFFLVMYRDKQIKISMPAMLIMVFYSIYSSLVGVEVNVVAHLGGLLSGMLLMLVFYPRRKLHEG